MPSLPHGDTVCDLCADPDVLLLSDDQVYCGPCWLRERPRPAAAIASALRAPAKPRGVTYTYGSLTPEREAALERERRAINRAMVAAATERDHYVARAAAGVPTPETQAHEEWRRRQAAGAAPERTALRQRALAWLTEDLEDNREHRGRRQEPAPAPRRERRIPLGYVQGCPWRVTMTQARLLDLRALGASVAEIARLETISAHTARTTLKRLAGVLCDDGDDGDDAPTAHAALAAWRAWCAASGRAPDPALARGLSLLRGRPAPDGHTDGAKPALSPPQWELLWLLAEGHTNGAIAAARRVRTDAIKAHTTRLYRALGVQRRAQAVAWYWAHHQEQEPEVPHAG